MRQTSNDLVEKFYHKEKENFPELTMEQFKEVCYGPWKFLKQEMESGELPTVRLKYFGVFQVFEGRARHMLSTIDHRVAIESISEKKHKELKTMIINFLNKK